MYLPSTLKTRDTVIGVISFKDFKTKLLPSLTDRTKWLLSDGMCVEDWSMGESISEADENRVETYVAGGDNNYHYTDEQIQDDTQVSLTPTGFFLPDTLDGERKIVNFNLLEKGKLPASIKTLKDLADFQKANPKSLLFGDYDPHESVGVSLASAFIEEKKAITVIGYNHYEDAQEEDTTCLLSHPVTILPNHTAQIKDLPGAVNETGEYFCLFTPVENVWHKSPLFASLVTVAPTLATFIATAKANPVKIGKEINDRWQTRIVDEKLTGATGAKTYLSKYGKSIQADKLLALAQKAQTEGDTAMADTFYAEAFGKNPLAGVTTKVVKAKHLVTDPVPTTLSAKFRPHAEAVAKLYALATDKTVKKELASLYTILASETVPNTFDKTKVFLAATTPATDVKTLEAILETLNAISHKEPRSGVGPVIPDLFHLLAVVEDPANAKLVGVLEKFVTTHLSPNLTQYLLQATADYMGSRKDEIFASKCKLLIKEVEHPSCHFRHGHGHGLQVAHGNIINSEVYDVFQSQAHGTPPPKSDAERSALIKAYVREFKASPQTLQRFSYGVANHLPKFLVDVKKEAMTTPAVAVDFTYDGYLVQAHKESGFNYTEKEIEESLAVATQAAFTPRNKGRLPTSMEYTKEVVTRMIKNGIISRKLLESAVTAPCFIPEQLEVKEVLKAALEETK